MIRFPDWASRLEVFLRANAARRFKYGEWDCCLFVAAAIETMTGIDLALPFRGTYRSRKEARAHGRVAAISQRVFDTALEPVPVLKAQRGDVVLIQRSRDHSLGVLGLNGRDVVAVAKSGFLHLPLRLALSAWHV